jgi:DNA-binding CsgD family transcriptional regulator
VRQLERGLRLARVAGHNHLVPDLLLAQGTMYGLSGRLSPAQSRIDDALEAALLTGSDQLRSLALAQKSWLLVWRGDLAGGLRAGADSVALSGPIADWASAVARGRLASCRLYAGDPDGCIDLMMSAGGGPDLPAVDPVTRVDWFKLLSLAEAARDRTAEAVRWADRALALATTMHLPGRLGFAQLAQAFARRPVDPDQALTYARAAVESFSTCGDQVHIGRAHLAAGIALGELGDTQQAREELQRATRLFQACGAALFESETLRAQRRLNARRPRRSRRRGSGAELTARERQIAYLASTGLTNRQIAKRLYLSPKTVEVHLSRVYAKLGIATRAALANSLAGGDSTGRP